MVLLIRKCCKALKYTGDRIRMTKYGDIFSKCHTGKCSNKISVIDSVCKTNLLT